ncbi:TIGR03826 family flagellar region protein [Bacillus infantis]|uniref:TIGR03826 family flagellar region protein n=1 Tax=Bacillus infantis TaxID=324767 RepID=UPI0021555FAD|nr:hypothetical protein [Bacillus infantis]
MAELSNCPICGELFVRNQFREVCQSCWKDEEMAFETVYQYIRKRENRAATIVQVENATSVDEDLILKFIRTGRLKITQFPNLGYPCDKCGAIIREGKLCTKCKDSLIKGINAHNEEEERKRERAEREKNSTYFSANQRNNSRSF